MRRYIFLIILLISFFIAYDLTAAPLINKESKGLYWLAQNNSQSQNTKIDNVYKALDKAHISALRAQKNVQSCDSETYRLELDFINMLSNEQLELFSNFKKAKTASSVVDMKLFSNRLIETLDSGQVYTYNNYTESLIKCSEITSEYQSLYDDFMYKKNAFLEYIRLLFSDDPQEYNLMLYKLNQRYP